VDFVSPYISKVAFSLTGVNFPLKMLEVLLPCPIASSVSIKEAGISFSFFSLEACLLPDDLKL
jgi:hypothetical protein